MYLEKKSSRGIESYSWKENSASRQVFGFQEISKRFYCRNAVRDTLISRWDGLHNLLRFVHHQESRIQSSKKTFCNIVAEDSSIHVACLALLELQNSHSRLYLLNRVISLLAEPSSCRCIQSWLCDGIFYLDMSLKGGISAYLASNLLI